VFIRANKDNTVVALERIIFRRWNWICQIWTLTSY